MAFDLKAKVGPLPLWGWGAVVAGGAFVLIKSGGGTAAKQGSGGQGTGTLPTYNSDTTLTQTIGDAYPVNQFGYGPNDSYISDSFFGSPLSLWTAGPMDYTGMFRDHRNRDRQQWDTHGRGGRSRGRRDRGRGGQDAFDNRGGSDNGFGQNSPPGGGGFGYHHSKGPRFPSAPPGGEGFDNGGQSFVGGSGGGRAQNGGNPYAQQTTSGTQGQQYLVQKGDTLNGIAQKLWGPGSDGSSIATANAGALGNGKSNGQLAQGLLLTIPGAPQSGPPAPGGPSGNGIGGGSISANGSNYGVGGAYDNTGPGGGTSSAGASGGGSPTEGQSGGNSSRAKSGNASRNYATSQTGSPNANTQKGRRSKNR